MKEREPYALYHAAKTNDETALQTFINAGNAVEEKEEQPPWPAYAKAALELIRGKVNTHAKDKEGETPLHAAVKAGNTAKVWALIAKGADLEAKRSDTAYTPLHVAAYYGREAVATLLIANGADINAKDNSGDTPLHRAASRGHAAIARLLIANKADINAKNTCWSGSGYTPLHCAAWYGYEAVATLLIDNKADINAKNNDGSTPLGVAYYGNKEAMKALLRKHGGH